VDTTMTVYNMSGSEMEGHVHEFEGSTHLAVQGPDRHNHRFAGVTGKAIPSGNGKHVHEFCTNTDFTLEHYHIAKGTTGPNIKVGDNKHVHYIDSFTTVEREHRHEFEFATLIGPSPTTK
jgi:hypothetical protein